MIAASWAPVAEMRLVASDANLSLVHISVQIRDSLSCVTEYNLSSSVQVVPDSENIASLVDSLTQSSDGSGTTNNAISRMLASGNPNTVGQVITSLSREFNRINSEAAENAIASEKESLYELFECMI